MPDVQFMLAIDGVPSDVNPGDARVGSALAAAPVTFQGEVRRLQDIIDLLTNLPVSRRFSSDDGNLSDGQASLTIPGGYTPGLVEVYRNGMLLRTADYVATDGSTIALIQAARSDDVLDVRGLRAGGVLNAAPLQHQHNVADVLGAVTQGDVPKAPAVLDGTSLTGQLRSRFQDPIDLYGFVTTGFDGQSTPVDNHDVLAEVLTKAGRKCLLPHGRAYVGAALPTISDRSVVLHGMSRGEALVFADGVPGLKIVQPNYSKRTDIVGLSFETLGKESGGFAVTVEYDDADATLNSNQQRVRVAHCTFGGFYNESQGWAGAFDGYNAQWAVLQHLYGVGRVGTAAEIQAAKNASAASNGSALAQAKAGLAAKMFNMKRLIRLRSGNTYGIGGAFIRDVHVSNADALIEAAGGRSIEGIQISGFNAVGCRRAFIIDAPGSHGLVIQHGHLNVAERGVYANNAPEPIIKDIDAYKLPDAVDETVVVELAGNSSFFDVDFIAKNQTSDFSASGAFVGMRVRDTSYGRADFIVERASTGVDLSGTATSNDIVAHMRGGFGPTPSLVTDTTANANNVRRSPFKAIASNAAAVATTSGGVYPASLSMDVLAGEEYEVGLTIGHTNNGAAADFLATLVRVSGTSNVTFQNGAGNVNLRVNQAANQNTALALAARMKVVQSGTLSLGALVQCLSNNGTVPANACALTVREL